MDLPPPSLLALLREKELWILILIGLLYWYRPLLMGDTFYFRDLYLLFWPKYHFLSETLKAREWPLWNPFMYGGLPFLADISNSVLSPATLLFLLLPPLTAFNLTIILHLELCYVDKLPWKVHYWGGSLVDEWNPLILSLYVGGVGIFLMILGGVSRSTNENFPVQARRFLLLVWLGAFIFATLSLPGIQSLATIPKAFPESSVSWKY